MLKVIVALAVPLLAAAPSLACDGHKKDAQVTAKAAGGDGEKDCDCPEGTKDCPSHHGKKGSVAMSEVTVDQLADLIAKAQKNEAKVAVFDANSEKTRASKGVIPGAVLLKNDATDVSVLPKDKSTSLVFYCAGERCSASHRAAKRALEAGYGDVRVLKAGIAGWVAAGKETSKIPQA